ncbi:MAG: glycosyltransferase family 4 protein [Candidatus Competibacteraceae bacterium]|nr:glycosyltransferase family 4 protein [Candidatus Competibacteraceae bacterium]
MTGSNQGPTLAYLVSQYPRISETFILREVRALRDLGITIQVASVNEPDRPAERLTAIEREEHAKTYYLKRHGIVGALRANLLTLVSQPMQYWRVMGFAWRLGGWDFRKCVYGLFYFIEAVMVGQWMRSRQLRHLHVHFATPASTVGLIASRLFQLGLSITVHGPDEFYDAPGYRLAEKIRGASFICCIGQYARSQLMKLSEPADWSKFEITPLGVDPTVFTPRPFNPNPELPEIICVGRLVPAKGQHILLAAIDQLAREGRQLKLRLVGDGPDRTALEQDVQVRQLDRYVTLEGAVNQDRIRELYSRADVFVLASFAEGIPVVLMEAMAMEIPCVATFITGIPELIRDGEEGLLVAPSDAEGLAKAIARLLDDAELRRRLGVAGRQKVLSHYHLQRNIERLAAIFQRRLSNDSH